VVLIILILTTYVGMLTVVVATDAEVVMGMATSVIGSMTSVSEKRHLATGLWVDSCYWRNLHGKQAPNLH
jgi:hypothetical protein